MEAIKPALTNLQAHRLLYCLVQLRYIPKKANGESYSVPGLLRRYTPAHWDDYNSRDIREMCAEQIRRTTCIICDEPMSKSTTGDHLIPLSRGGKEGLPNYIALCKSHNSSKGPKDFVEWWTGKGWKLEQAHPDVLCMYSRLRYQLCRDTNILDFAAPDYLVEALRSEILNQPSPDRKAILISSGLST